jgi:DnaJ-class molecular chaperone
MSNSPTSTPANTEGARRNPGDEAEPGASQTGEDICPVCNGSGKKADQSMCANCGGTGKVIRIVGDA